MLLFFRVSLLVILADISHIFTFCSGQFIVSFIYLSKMLYAMLSTGAKGKVKLKQIEPHVKSWMGVVLPAY